MPRAYTEDQLVEQPAIEIFLKLGWETVSAMEEVFGAEGTLGRETSGETILAQKLRAALKRLDNCQVVLWNALQQLLKP